MEKKSPFLISCGNFFFKYRDMLFPAFFVFLVLIFHPQFPQQGVLNYSLEGIALLVAFIGELFRAVTVGLEYIIRGGLDKEVYAENLVTGGMFAHCRNPLYVGNLLMVFALLIIANNAWVYLFGGAFIVFVYISIVAAEERFLHEKFGAEFETYCKRVNRWLPNFKGFGETISQMQFNWRRVFVKEYSSVYFWFLSVLVLVTYKTLLHFSVEEAKAPLIVIFGLLVLSTSTFIFLRFLKKSRRLTEKSFNLFHPAT